MRALPSRRLLAVALVAVVAAAPAALPTAAGAELPPYKREAKKIKKALVAIELDHDEVLDDLAGLRARVPAWDAEIAAAERRLSAVAGSDRLFEVAEAAFRVHHAVERKAASLARITDLERLENRLVARREAKIAELEDIVRERVRAKRSGPALTLNGSLVTYSADWEAVSMCESSGRWHINSQFDGGLQFHPLTWLGFGGGEFARYAYQASKIEQIAIAERVLAIQGPKAWPNCFTPLPYGF